jgi:hypothetical protein
VTEQGEYVDVTVITNEADVNILLLFVDNMPVVGEILKSEPVYVVLSTAFYNEYVITHEEFVVLA